MIKKIFSFTTIIIISSIIGYAQDVISDTPNGTDGKRVIKTRRATFKSNQWTTSTSMIVFYDIIQDDVSVTLFVTANTHNTSKPISGCGKHVTISTDKGTVIDSVECDVEVQDTNFYSKLWRDFTTCCYMLHPNDDQLATITAEGIYCLRDTDTGGGTPFDIIPKKGKLTKLIQQSWSNITARLHRQAYTKNTIPVPGGTNEK